MLAAAQISFLDRSGLRIPDTSPFVDELTMLRDGVSVQDKSQPASLFGSLAYDMGSRGQLTLTSGWQQVDANAEWLDYGALTHFSRVRLSNLYARLGYDVNVTDDAALKAFTSVALASPMDGHKIRPLSGFALRPNEARHLEETYKSQAVLSGVELSWDLPDHGIGVRVGTDLDIDVQQLARVSAVTDEEQVGSQVGDTITVATSRVEERTFTNVGLYLQVAAHPLDFMDVIGGLRYDFYSIYASALNGRVGMVFRANDWLYFKALYGSSFRAPAPDQLYRGQAYTGDALGCLDYEPCAAIGLKPQTAHTGEVVAGVRYQDTLNLQLTGFVSFVDDLIISFPNYANAFVTTNAGEYLSTGARARGVGAAQEHRRRSGHRGARVSRAAEHPDGDPAESVRSRREHPRRVPRSVAVPRRFGGRRHRLRVSAGSGRSVSRRALCRRATRVRIEPRTLARSVELRRREPPGLLRARRKPLDARPLHLRSWRNRALDSCHRHPRDSPRGRRLPRLGHSDTRTSRVLPPDSRVLNCGTTELPIGVRMRP